MRLVIRLGAVALVCLASGGAGLAEATPAKLFACAIGANEVSVTAAGGRLVYHYGTADKEQMTIVGIPASGNIFQLTQRFAGMEYQLRFKNGEYSYIVYSSEGNARSGASATSGLVVMRGTKTISDKACAPLAELAMPGDLLKGVPEDSDKYSAL